MQQTALITGYGQGLGEAVAAQLSSAGYHIVACGRSLPQVRSCHGLTQLNADLSDPTSMQRVFETIDSEMPPLSVLIHNPGHLLIQPFLTTELNDFTQVWADMVQSAFVVSQLALERMVGSKRGTLIISGATASIRGGAQFAAFASAKFALRGLAQSLAREFQPQGIHVVHTILDGIIWSEKSRQRHNIDQASCLLPDDIARAYCQLIEQSPSAWTHELDLRPFSERF